MLLFLTTNMAAVTSRANQQLTSVANTKLSRPRFFSFSACRRPHAVVDTCFLRGAAAGIRICAIKSEVRCI